MFSTFAKQAKCLVYNADDAHLVKIAAQHPNAVSFGSVLSNADFRLLGSIVCKGERFEHFFEDVDGIKHELSLQLPGNHNAMNALAVITGLHVLGWDVEKALSVVNSFKGVRRRMELVGVQGGVHYYLDYAHHPDEIKATVNTALVMASYESRLGFVPTASLYADAPFERRFGCGVGLS